MGLAVKPTIFVPSSTGPLATCVNRISALSDPTATEVTDGRHNRYQKPVFITVRESLKDGERVVTRNLPGVVWLQSLDECPLIAGNALNAVCAVSEVPFVHGNRELCSALSSHVRRCEFVDEVVEGGPHVVDRVPDRQREFARRDFSHHCEDVVLDFFARSAAFLSPERERCGISFAKGRYLLADRIDVLLAPIELEVDAAEVRPSHRSAS